MNDDGELEPGERYGDYEVVDVLGRGAFAAVYRVRAPGFIRDAALKLSLRPVGDSDAAARALREIAVLRTLTNHHVVRVHAAGQGEDGRVFILMDCLEGQQLDEFHDFDEPMPAAQATWMIHQACLGLAEAHTRGIVHRDIKPANLWVEPDHNVRVIDFGLARAWDRTGTIGSEVTIGRLLVGTPHYSQPEQLHSNKLLPASDVYSLAVVLYELLSGRCLFFPEHGFSEVRDRLRDDPVPWLAAHRSALPLPLDRYPHLVDLPPALGELVLQCLEKLPELRPADAGVLANALGSILHYDFGVAVAAMLEITLPWGGFDQQLLLPGIHRIGSARDVEIHLRGPDVQPLHAVLEWSGLPDLPQLRPLVDDGSVRIGGRPIHGRAELQRGDRIEVGPFALALSYPS
ncbi:MAG: protein kinase [Deltaproteobacteria bacterium]|nr:protein kinase [Deltaproteobacteria bacterium]